MMIKTKSYRTLLVGVAAAALMGAGPSAGEQQSAALPELETPRPTDQELETVEIRPSADLYEQRLAEVEHYLNGISSMRAHFVQQGPDGQLTRGTFHLQRPGRVRFEYDGDIPILVVSDGKTLNLVDYDLRQVTKWPVNDTPLALLLADKIVLGENVTLVAAGPGELANMISITASDPKRPEQGTMTVFFSTAPREDGAGFDLALQGWQVEEAQGSFTTVRLSDAELNPSLKASLWKFEDPRAERFERRTRRR